MLLFKVVSPSLLRRREPTGGSWCQMDIHVSTGVSSMVAPPQSYQICHRPSLRAIRHDTKQTSSATHGGERGARVHLLRHPSQMICNRLQLQYFTQKSIWNRLQLLYFTPASVWKLSLLKYFRYYFLLHLLLRHPSRNYFH